MDIKYAKFFFIKKSYVGNFFIKKLLREYRQKQNTDNFWANIVL